jgi:AcrR family transcriptional regulator
MFSEYGYDGVSMRDLAKEVGITNPSIYNHFASKKDILDSIYRFYTDQRKKVRPDLTKLLKLAETMPPHEVLMMTDYRFEPAIQDIMHRIFSIAAGGIATKLESRQFIIDNIFAPSEELVVPLLEKMTELGRIEKIDIAAFNNICSHYCFSVMTLNTTPMKLSTDAWRQGLRFLFSFIKATGR